MTEPLKCERCQYPGPLPGTLPKCGRPTCPQRFTPQTNVATLPSEPIKPLTVQDIRNADKVLEENSLKPDADGFYELPPDPRPRCSEFIGGDPSCIMHHGHDGPCSSGPPIVTADQLDHVIEDVTFPVDRREPLCAERPPDSLGRLVAMAAHTIRVMAGDLIGSETWSRDVAESDYELAKRLEVAAMAIRDTITTKGEVVVVTQPPTPEQIENREATVFVKVQPAPELVVAELAEGGAFAPLIENVGAICADAGMNRILGHDGHPPGERTGANAPEPPPTPSKHPAVWDLVLRDIAERDKAGAAKYGTRLQPHNGRRPLVDAYQEALDLVVYLRQEIYERYGE